MDIIAIIHFICQCDCVSDKFVFLYIIDIIDVGTQPAYGKRVHTYIQSLTKSKS